MQGKCECQAFSIQELEAKLGEEMARNKEFNRQLHEEAERCHYIEVLSHSTTSIFIHFLYIYGIPLKAALCMYLHVSRSVRELI